jgi:hypothetical protein
LPPRWRSAPIAVAAHGSTSGATASASASASGGSLGSLIQAVIDFFTGGSETTGVDEGTDTDQDDDEGRPLGGLRSSVEVRVSYLIAS